MDVHVASYVIFTDYSIRFISFDISQTMYNLLTVDYRWFLFFPYFMIYITTLILLYCRYLLPSTPFDSILIKNYHSIINN